MAWLADCMQYYIFLYQKKLYIVPLKSGYCSLGSLKWLPIGLCDLYAIWDDHFACKLCDIRQQYFVQVRSASGQCCQSDVLIGANCTQNLISTALRTHKCIKCCPLGHTFAHGTLRDYKSCFAAKESVNGSGTEKHFLPSYGRTSISTWPFGLHLCSWGLKGI